MMKRWIPLALLIAGGAFAQQTSTPAPAPTEGFGVGFIVGSPTGLSGTLPIGDHNAFNALIGYDLAGNNANITLGLDYVWHRRDLIQPPEGEMSVYYGPGALVRLSSDAAVGIRGVAGLSWRPPANPLEFLIEVGPGVTILPETEALVTAGIGLRYYF